jgi:hypothetical protein
MSTEPDYNFNDPAVPADLTTGGPSLHLPFALLCVALAVVMITQTANTFKVRSSLREGKAQLADAYRNREPAVKQSAELQAKLQAMILDLLLLAKTDKDAQDIVTKYNIQQAAPAGATPETPAAAPAPEK